MIISIYLAFLGKLRGFFSNTNESKRVLVTVRTILSLQGMVLNVTSTSLDELVLEKINLPVNFPQKAKGTLKKPRNFGFGLKRGGVSPNLKSLF